CSLEVDCADLARIGLFFAMRGKCMRSGCAAEKLVSKEVAAIVTTIMITSGMYNRSGEFFLKVGLPAKSGVSGGILSFAPDRYGFGLFGPAIDEAGNSAAGVRMLARLSRACGLHLVG